MKITAIRSHVLRCDMPETLGYSQQYYTQRTAHLVEVSTDEGITGWGECFGPGAVARANARIVEDVIAPMVVGRDPRDRDPIWHHVHNLLRDHGQKGMPIQALSGVDIALWDIAGKAAGLSVSRLMGGRFREDVPVYGYGMMLRPVPVDEMAPAFEEEAAAIREAGFAATKMKVGVGVRGDVRLIEAVARGAGPMPFAADANHAYDAAQALEVGAALDAAGAMWFEEPVAPEDRAGYAFLRARLSTPIAGGEAEFTRWGWRDLLACGGLSIAQPEICGLGGISEYLRVLALCHAAFVPVVPHVWGSAVAVAANLQVLAAMPPLPGGLFPREPMLEFDTTENRFRDALLEEPLDIRRQVSANGGRAAIPDRPGLGVEPDRGFIDRYAIT